MRMLLVGLILAGFVCSVACFAGVFQGTLAEAGYCRDIEVSGVQADSRQSVTLVINACQRSTKWYAR